MKVHGAYHKVSIGYKQFSDNILKEFEKTFKNVETVIIENSNLKSLIERLVSIINNVDMIDKQKIERIIEILIKEL
jgi:hypothetical protein